MHVARRSRVRVEKWWLPSSKATPQSTPRKPSNRNRLCCGSRLKRRKESEFFVHRTIKKWERCGERRGAHREQERFQIRAKEALLEWKIQRRLQVDSVRQLWRVWMKERRNEETKNLGRL
ncbi:hypothetical protein E2542_SST04565 [Spatholobus suberectus]|nr:hypothetical protein E2542_SST04565 [Spatholobus suberectus]